MKKRKFSHYACYGLLILLMVVSVFAQGERGKAELKAPNGSLIVDYGRPTLQGRDMLSKLSIGDYWRLGKDDVTVLSAPVDLIFGSTTIPKGNHSLWLKRQAPDRFELVFNKQASGMGMDHDAAKDETSVPMNKSALSNSLEELMIELQPAPQGGILAIEWGTAKLTASFQFGK